MKKLKYTKPEAEVVHFHLMDGDLYTLSGGQNGNDTGGGDDSGSGDGSGDDAGRSDGTEGGEAA